MSKDEAFKLMRPQAGGKICRDSFEALDAYLGSGEGQSFSAKI